MRSVVIQRPAVDQRSHDHQQRQQHEAHRTLPSARGLRVPAGQDSSAASTFSRSVFSTNRETDSRASHAASVTRSSTAGSIVHVTLMRLRRLGWSSAMAGLYPTHGMHGMDVYARRF